MNLKSLKDNNDENDCEMHTSFPENANLDSKIPFFSSKELISRTITEDYKIRMNKYLGVCGIIPLSIIEYIKKNKIYF